MGIPSTGKQVSGTGMFMDRIVNGKAVEPLLNGDTLDLLQQIGAVPTPGQAGQRPALSTLKEGEELGSALLPSSL
jgi:hypothetical protein